MIRFPVYSYAVKVEGRLMPPTLTFQALDGATLAGAVYAPEGSKVEARRAGVSKKVLKVPRPDNPAEFVIMDAAEAVAEAQKGSFGLAIHPPAPEP